MQERGGGHGKRSGTCEREVAGAGREVACVRERWWAWEEKLHV